MVVNNSKKKSNVRTIVFLISISFLVVLVIICGYYVVPQVKLNGQTVMTINYKEKYTEEGYKAYFLNKDISDKVVVSGYVDSSKLGTYKIIYTIDGIFKKKVTRTIKVKDISKPTLDVGNDENIYLCPGDEFKKGAVKAYDNYDGDISDKVEVIVDDNKVIYRVFDSSGNVSEARKKLIYEDVLPPTIKLNGSKYVYAFKDEEYIDAGFYVVDNCDKDIVNKVEVINGVDTTKVGKYEVVYNVTDVNGNASKETRTVIVSERDAPGTIYLTFDDGPQAGTTDVILDILKEEGIEATFFITNKGPDELIKRMYDEGHTVALHTATHNYESVYSSIDAYFNDLNLVNERVKRVTGEYSYIIRFPGGSSNTISRRYSQGIMSELTKEVVNRGYKYYDWNLSSGDAEGGRPTPEIIRDNVINNLKKTRVNMVLLHDIKTYTRDAIRGIIHYGKENGYTFEKITMDTEMVTQRVNN